ncbi:hypothetical protein NBRC111894_3256 [Sporolactobacillus inulinus]|uniref:Uncharacterized protein n=1 Tax=Sporolactobacillus inulinus TaxID=2078 RepID=A0A4Y1ZET6_9BACL|nr:hypothetical protein NBRC111894_3256 [Sporolactobacillus inulinus]
MLLYSQKKQRYVQQHLISFFSINRHGYHHFPKNDRMNDLVILF